MKRTFLCLAVAAALAALASANAQEAVDENLRLEVEGLVKLFERKKYDQVIQGVEQIQADGDLGGFVANLKGAALTKLKDYEGAKAAFESALEKSPGLFSATYNLGEILFLQKKYPQALAWFQRMLANDPRNELLQFKVFLCQLLTEDVEAARKTLSRMRFPGETPAWYYAYAAWELHRGNRRQAMDYLNGARFIFPGKTELFDETFSELGWPTK